MHGMFDHQARVAFARERAEGLHDVMRASRRRRQTSDEADRRKPVHSDASARATPLRPQRGSM